MNELLSQIVVNCATGEHTVVALTTEEQEQRQLEMAEYLAQETVKLQAQEEAAIQRQALLIKLGITQEEAKLLLS